MARHASSPSVLRHRERDPEREPGLLTPLPTRGNPTTNRLKTQQGQPHAATGPAVKGKACLLLGQPDLLEDTLIPNPVHGGNRNLAERNGSLGRAGGEP